MEFGKHMYGSHYGLKDKYEVSCADLDALVTIAEGFEGVIGARMMGGGFGGCTINLVKKMQLVNSRILLKRNIKLPMVMNLKSLKL